MSFNYQSYTHFPNHEPPRMLVPSQSWPFPSQSWPLPSRGHSDAPSYQASNSPTPAQVATHVSIAHPVPLRASHIGLYPLATDEEIRTLTRELGIPSTPDTAQPGATASQEGMQPVDVAAQESVFAHLGSESSEDGWIADRSSSPALTMSEGLTEFELELAELRECTNGRFPAFTEGPGSPSPETASDLYHQADQQPVTPATAWVVNDGTYTNAGNLDDGNYSMISETEVDLSLYSPSVGSSETDMDGVQSIGDSELAMAGSESALDSLFEVHTTTSSDTESVSDGTTSPVSPSMVDAAIDAAIARTEQMRQEAAAQFLATIEDVERRDHLHRIHQAERLRWQANAATNPMERNELLT
ncbi:hypothetical protein FRC11_013960, partial [Ceratobasidium sp. 423]